MPFRFLFFWWWIFPACLLAQTGYTIPKQQFLFKTGPGKNDRQYRLKTDSFTLSPFITLGEYKKFLAVLRKDSGDLAWRTHLPDSTACAKTAWIKYLSDTAYDAYPALCVSWDNALDYCRWKTITENPEGPVSFIYRLPTANEWMAAQHYLDSTQTKNDLNDLYSDWTLTTMDESVFDFTHNMQSDGMPQWIGSKSDPKVLRRKVIIGNSYRFSRACFGDYFQLSYYAFSGYPQAGFRVLREPVHYQLKPDRQGGNKLQPDSPLQRELETYWNISF